MLDVVRPIERGMGRTGADRRPWSLPIRRPWRWAGVGLVVVALAASAVSWGFGWFDASDSPSPRVAPGEFVLSRQASHALVWAVGDGADGDEESKALARRIARTRALEEISRHWDAVVTALRREAERE